MDPAAGRPFPKPTPHCTTHHTLRVDGNKNMTKRNVGRSGDPAADLAADLVPAQPAQPAPRAPHLRTADTITSYLQPIDARVEDKTTARLIALCLGRCNATEAVPPGPQSVRCDRCSSRCSSRCKRRGLLRCRRRMHDYDAGFNRAVHDGVPAHTARACQENVGPGPFVVAAKW